MGYENFFSNYILENKTSDRTVMAKSELYGLGERIRRQGMEGEGRKSRMPFMKFRFLHGFGSDFF